MGLLKKLFGARPDPSDGGIYLYVQCDRCEQIVRLRLEPEHELVPDEGGYCCHKTVVDTRCYRRIPAVFHFGRDQRLSGADIDGGRLVDQAAHDAQVAASRTQTG